ncbi:MAG: type II secretion system F family protein, partial [Saccharofermentanales bacterium]
SAIRMIVMFSLFSFSLLPLAFPGFPVAGRFLIFLMGTVLAILVPRYYLKSSIKKRQEGIRGDLPDILDLISVSVEAGLGFDFAILRVVNRSKGPLAEELKVVYREIQMGIPRREALKSLADRSDVEELRTFVSSIIQADTLGISIKNVLRAQSSQLRQTRRQRAEEKAMKAPVKMILPLVIFIFPVIFIILLGPSVMEIAGTFGGLG